MSASKIPTITLGPVQVPVKKAKPKVKPKKEIKKAAKVKAKPAKKAKAKKVAKPKRQYGKVPVDMAPPEMTDTRPVPVHEPPVEAKPTTPTVALGDGTGDITVDETKTAKKVQVPVPVDTRLVQGAQCTWIGPLEAAPDSPATSQPVCPFCGGNLITCPDRATMELGLEQFELGAYESINPAPRRHPGYKDLVHWMLDQPTCWTTIEEAAVSYKEATGKTVDPSR